MELEKIVSALSQIERKALAALSAEPKTHADITKLAGLNVDSVRRATNWLNEKGLAKIDEKTIRILGLSQEGRHAEANYLPEDRMLKELEKKGRMPLKEIQEKAMLSEQEFKVGLGENKRNAFVVILKETEPTLQLTEVGKEELKNNGPEKRQKMLKELAGEKSPDAGIDSKQLVEWQKRGLVKATHVKNILVSITPHGQRAREMPGFAQARTYNIRDPAPPVYAGKKQPYIQFLNLIRRKLTELGFREMESPLIVHEFYNFDALFQPQDHPARTWTDTYQLKNPDTGKLVDRRSVKAIKAAHETGGASISSGWGYTWLEEIASKVMPAAHGTAHSAKQLTRGIEMPGKYFAIARCFRPDVLDATHLIEFNQVDGFIVAENLNFSHLLGVLEQFAREIGGAEEVRFMPDYYPFTEPSCQLSAKHPKLGWVELGGAGMFRPEMLENLGIKGRAIAWGIGIDRLAMFKLGIKDIRHLFSDDLKWLREAPLVRN